MPEPTELLAEYRTSTTHLLTALDAEDWTDADVAAPSLCDGWTRGHVLTHIARNADSITNTLEGALRGEIVKRYPRGWDARNEDIDDGASRPLAVLLADVRESAARLDQTFEAIAAADAWDQPTERNRPAAEWPWWRLREVEIHHVDLAGSYPAKQWPTVLIARQIPESLDTLDERIDQPIRVEIESVSIPELDGLTWTSGLPGEPITVRGPDWAVLAWLTGRAAAAEGALTATPPLQAWK